MRVVGVRDLVERGRSVVGVWSEMESERSGWSGWSDVWLLHVVV